MRMADHGGPGNDGIPSSFQPERPRPAVPEHGRWMDSRLAALLLLAGLLAGSGCRRVADPSSAMEPTIKAGEKITIDFSAYAAAAPRRWDVVAFEPAMFTNTLHVKRVIGLPGETISLTASGIVANGSFLAMPSRLSNVVYCAPERLPWGQRGSLIVFPYSVPPQQYFLVGDNWTNSYDSRFYGAVAATNILGRVRNK
jgi:signal peptidase I